MSTACVSTCVLVRDSLESDVAAITDIYAHHVLHGTACFETEPPTAAEMGERRAAILARQMPYLTATREGQVVGYAYATPYRARAAYAFTVEDSVYVHADMAGLGIGSALMSALVARCQNGPWRQMIANVGDSANVGSLQLHAKFGFHTIGTCQGVGFKFGKWLDTVLMQRALGNEPVPQADAHAGAQR